MVVVVVVERPASAALACSVFLALSMLRLAAARRRRPCHNNAWRRCSRLTSVLGESGWLIWVWSMAGSGGMRLSKNVGAACEAGGVPLLEGPLCKRSAGQAIDRHAS